MVLVIKKKREREKKRKKKEISQLNRHKCAMFRAACFVAPIVELKSVVNKFSTKSTHLNI